MSENSKFTKREWVHLIITISIIEGFIFWVSFQFSGNSSALGYVSFAGTLISIILAVLAIGYTYGESQQQKNSSLTLANQLESLVKVKEELQIQAYALDDIKGLKTELINMSNDVKSHFNTTNSNIDDVKKNILLFARSPNNIVNDVSESVKFIQNVNNFNDQFSAMVYCILAVFLDKGTKFNSYENLFEIINISNYDFPTTISKESLRGACVVACNNLIFLGLINRENFVHPDLIDLFNLSGSRLTKNGGGYEYKQLEDLHTDFMKTRFAK